MRHILLLSVVLAALGVPATARAQSYPSLLARLAVDDAVLRAQVRVDAMSESGVERHVRSNIEQLFRAWKGTSWGLGRPQTDTPGAGKINCGTFVGTVLRDAGFDVDHKRLQRQPSELIVKSFASKEDIRRFRNTSMTKFIDGVREMGPGLFIIGLDYHVGFIAVEADGRVRFIHAGVYPGRVVDEPAAGAREISESRYRVVGKILRAKSLEAWTQRRAIAIHGNW